MAGLHCDRSRIDGKAAVNRVKFVYFIASFSVKLYNNIYYTAHNMVSAKMQRSAVYLTETSRLPADKV